MKDQLKVSESTEVNIPLKTLIAIIAGLLSASWYIFGTQAKIHNLETELKILHKDFESYKKQPGRNTTEVELLKKDLEYLKEHKH